jgi:hypothetical protein
VAACLLGIGALEVLSERVRVDLASTTAQRAPDGRPDSSPAYPKGTLVVTEETQGAGLALLMPGDVIRVEAPHGQIQRIVVLRRGWQELESPEK